jgi:hypothetical protein
MAEPPPDDRFGREPDANHRSQVGDLGQAETGLENFWGFLAAASEKPINHRRSA